MYPLPLMSQFAYLLQANDFKDRLSNARETLNNLPGGEMLPGDQDQIIALLKELRDRKR
jgi:hypothetical protein